MARIEERVHADGKTKSWRVSWRLGGRREGRWQCVTVTSNPKEASRVADLVKAHGHTLTGDQVAEMLAPRPRTGRTVADWTKRYVDSLTVEDSTRREYERTVRMHLRGTSIGSLDIAEVTREHVRLWIRELTTRGASPKSVANHHGLLSAALSDAATSREIAANPCAGIRLPRKDAKTEHADEMCFLTPEEVKLIAGEMPEPYQAVPWILARTGLRWSELTALQVREVDLMARPPRLRVVQAWKRDARGGVKLGPPKTPRSRRTVTLDKATFDLLLPLVAGKPADAWVVTTPRDGKSPLPHTTFMRQWHKALYGVKPRTAKDRLTPEQIDALPPDKRAAHLGLVGSGLLEKRPRIHDLRHTHASWLIEAGVSMYRIQRRLGHESILTTEGTYGHLRQDEDAEVLGALDGLLADGALGDLDEEPSRVTGQ